MADPAPAPSRPEAPDRAPGAFLRRYGWWAAGFALLAAALALWIDAQRPAPGGWVEGLDVETFVQPGCRHCEAAKRFLATLEREQPGLVVVHRNVLRDRWALARLRALTEQAHVERPATPTLFVHGVLVVGWRDEATSGRRVRSALARPRPSPTDVPTAETDEGKCPLDLDDEEAPPPKDAKDEDCTSKVGAAEKVTLPLLGEVSAKDVGLPLFTVVIGLIDGFNPCAMWVLLFLLSLLVNLRSRPKMFAIAGTFVVASGLCYFAFMAAWLSFFDLVGQTRLVQVGLGALALFVGAVHVKDYFAFHRGVTLSIPESAKPGLYARVTSILRANRLAGAMLGVVALAFLVNMVELLCTAGLPAVYTGVLSSYGMPRWEEYLYLALYQVFYMLDDSVMLVIAIVTLSKRRLQEGGGRVLKLVSGGVIAVLGLLLLFRPEWLAW